MSQDYIFIFQKLVHGLQKDKLRLLQKKIVNKCIGACWSNQFRISEGNIDSHKYASILEQCNEIKEILKNKNCNGIVIVM